MDTGEAIKSSKRGEKLGTTKVRKVDDEKPSKKNSLGGDKIGADTTVPNVQNTKTKSSMESSDSHFTMDKKRVKNFKKRTNDFSAKTNQMDQKESITDREKIMEFEGQQESLINDR